MDIGVSEFKPLRVANLHLPGNEQAKTVLQPLIRSELRKYRNNLIEQFDVMLDCVEARMHGGSIENYERRFLEYDMFYSNYEKSRGKKELRRDLVTRFDGLIDDLVPVLETGEPDFWRAVPNVYTEEEARELLDSHFSYMDTVEEYTDGITLSMTVGGRLIKTEVEYTDEAFRVLAVSEEEMKQKVGETVDEVYG